MRKDIRVGMYRSMFPRDFRTYYDPTQFVMTHPSVGGDNRTAQVPTNPFPNQTGFAEAGTVVAKNQKASQDDKPTPVTSSGKRIVYGNGVRWASETAQVTMDSKGNKSPARKGAYQIDRYEDIRRNR